MVMAGQGCFTIHVHDLVRTFFSITMMMIVRDANLLYSRPITRLEGRSIAGLAPSLFALVHKQRVDKRIMKEALLGSWWIRDIVGDLIVASLAEFLDIWELISVVQLRPGVQDEHHWKRLFWTISGFKILLATSRSQAWLSSYTFGS